MTLTEAKDFLTSLSPDKGQAEEMHGWRFDADLGELLQRLEGDPVFRSPFKLLEFSAYLLERCRRAESREVPDLKDKVKMAILAGMNAAQNSTLMRVYASKQVGKYDDLEWRPLCAPEEVKL